MESELNQFRIGSPAPSGKVFKYSECFKRINKRKDLAKDSLLFELLLNVSFQ